MNAAADLLSRVRLEVEPFVKEVEDGPFARDVPAGRFPLAAMRFVHTNRHHALAHDVANLNLFVGRARDEDEMLFFHSMATEGKARLDVLPTVADALGLDPETLAGSQPSAACLLRSNYFSRLAQYGTPGEIALATLVSSAVSVGGAQAEAQALRGHYRLSEPGPPSDDMTDGVIASLARDLQAGTTDERLNRAACWAAEYEAMVWAALHAEGTRAAA